MRKPWRRPCQPTSAAVSWTSKPDPVQGFLNVAATIPGLSTQPMWIVRNMLIHEIGEGVPFETVTNTFPMTDLGIETGMVALEIHYSYEVMNTPLLIDDSAAWLASQPLDRFSPVDQVVDEISHGVVVPENEIDSIDPQAWFSTTDAAGTDTVFCNIGCYMPNIDLGATGDANDLRACYPAGCSNSLQWLKKKYGDITFPHSQRSVMNQLGKLAGRTGPQGVSDQGHGQGQTRLHRGPQAAHPREGPGQLLPEGHQEFQRSQHVRGQGRFHCPVADARLHHAGSEEGGGC